ncbi:hypothetical protein F1559_003179 [Cyanidiococcus yangmingshanensis]|uniref:2-dehydropantoate 2-reductase n=1 Tax=Cyanidiococcus yangmingshanensis TaxID=2690220 RepID=A0A7J7IH37_9RHOD|nr:hypothetical protein F1559_003179 [Cyanidiococcus yangmingshanensis]
MATGLGTLSQSQAPRVAVIGSGAIGLLVFAKLAQLQQSEARPIFSKLALVCRSEQVAQQIQNKGGIDLINFETGDALGKQSASRACFCALDAPQLQVMSCRDDTAAGIDLALVCVKSYQIESIGSFLRRAFMGSTSPSAAVTFCNGIGHVPRLAALLPRQVAVLPAVTYMAAERLGTNKVQVHGHGATYILGKGNPSQPIMVRDTLKETLAAVAPIPFTSTSASCKRAENRIQDEHVTREQVRTEQFQHLPTESWFSALYRSNGTEERAPAGETRRPSSEKAPATAIGDQRYSPWGQILDLTLEQQRLLDERQGLCAWMNRAGIGPASIGQDERPFVEKLALNCGINPVATLLGVRNGALMRLPEALRLAEMAALEVAELFGMSGPPLLGKLRNVLGATAGNVNSMLADLLRGQPTEVDALNGAVADLMASRGDHRPSVNALLALIIRALTERRQQKLELGDIGGEYPVR